MTDLQKHFDQQVRALSGIKRWVIGLSGGLDSIALLHLAARSLPVERLLVLHVDHQLQSHSSCWSDFCQRQADALGLAFHSEKVSVDAGASLERAARNARYGVFTEVLESGDCLLLAQHRDDQAETMLFRLLRGAGLKGLAGMPGQRSLGKGRLLRPLQQVSRDELQQWAVAEKLSWIEDPSNNDLTFDRNYLRHKVMPPLQARWPGFSARWQETSEYLREADLLLEDLARIDLLQLTDTYNSLDCHMLVALTGPRRKNLLRFWLKDTGVMAGDRILKSILQLIEAAEDADPRLDLSGVSLRRYRGRLYRLRTVPEIDWSVHRITEDILQLPQGRLELSEVAERGLKTLQGVVLRNRRDGDRCTPVGRGGSTSLKKLFQEQNIPPWLRSSWPVCEVEGEIVALPGICICDGWQSEKNNTGFALKWLPAALFADNDSGTL